MDANPTKGNVETIQDHHECHGNITRCSFQNSVIPAIKYLCDLKRFNHAYKKLRDYVNKSKCPKLIAIFGSLGIKLNKSKEVISYTERISAQLCIEIVDQCINGNFNSFGVQKYLPTFIIVILNATLVQILMSYRVHPAYISKYFKLWMDRIVNSDDFEIMFKKLIGLSACNSYLFIMLDILKEFNCEPNMYLKLKWEIFIRAITCDLNEYEFMKFSPECNENDLFEEEKNMSHRYLQLAELCYYNIPVQSECLLTAYSLNPTRRIYSLIKGHSIAINTMKLHKEPTSLEKRCCKNLPANNLCDACGELITNDTLKLHDNNRNILSNECTEQIFSGKIFYVDGKVNSKDEDSLQQLGTDLITILTAPRNKTITLELEWETLNKNLLRLLKPQHKINLVKQYTSDANSKLKYLKLDYNKFRHLPEPELPGIEKGYEAYLDSEYETDEDINNRDNITKEVQTIPISYPNTSETVNNMALQQITDSTNDLSDFDFAPTDSIEMSLFDLIENLESTSLSSTKQKTNLDLHLNPRSPNELSESFDLSLPNINSFDIDMPNNSSDDIVALPFPANTSSTLGLVESTIPTLSYREIMPSQNIAHEMIVESGEFSNGLPNETSKCLLVGDITNTNTYHSHDTANSLDSTYGQIMPYQEIASELVVEPEVLNDAPPVLNSSVKEIQESLLLDDITTKPINSYNTTNSHDSTNSSDHIPCDQMNSEADVLNDSEQFANSIGKEAPKCLLVKDDITKTSIDVITNSSDSSNSHDTSIVSDRISSGCSIVPDSINISPNSCSTSNSDAGDADDIEEPPRNLIKSNVIEICDVESSDADVCDQKYIRSPLKLMSSDFVDFFFDEALKKTPPNLTESNIKVIDEEATEKSPPNLIGSEDIKEFEVEATTIGSDIEMFDDESIDNSPGNLLVSDYLELCYEELSPNQMESDTIQLCDEEVESPPNLGLIVEVQDEKAMKRSVTEYVVAEECVVDTIEKPSHNLVAPKIVEPCDIEVTAQNTSNSISADVEILDPIELNSQESVEITVLSEDSMELVTDHDVPLQRKESQDPVAQTNVESCHTGSTAQNTSNTIIDEVGFIEQIEWNSQVSDDIALLSEASMELIIDHAIPLQVKESDDLVPPTNVDPCHTGSTAQSTSNTIIDEVGFIEQIKLNSQVSDEITVLSEDSMQLITDHAIPLQRKESQDLAAPKNVEPCHTGSTAQSTSNTIIDEVGFIEQIELNSQVSDEITVLSEDSMQLITDHAIPLQRKESQDLVAPINVEPCHTESTAQSTSNTIIDEVGFIEQIELNSQVSDDITVLSEDSVEFITDYATPLQRKESQDLVPSTNVEPCHTGSTAQINPPVSSEAGVLSEASIFPVTDHAVPVQQNDIPNKMNSSTSTANDSGQEASSSLRNHNDGELTETLSSNLDFLAAPRVPSPSKIHGSSSISDNRSDGEAANDGSNKSTDEHLLRADLSHPECENINGPNDVIDIDSNCSSPPETDYDTSSVTSDTDSSDYAEFENRTGQSKKRTVRTAKSDSANRVRLNATNNIESDCSSPPESDSETSSVTSDTDKSDYERLRNYKYTKSKHNHRDVESNTDDKSNQKNNEQGHELNCSHQGWHCKTTPPQKSSYPPSSVWSYEITDSSIQQDSSEDDSDRLSSYTESSSAGSESYLSASSLIPELRQQLIGLLSSGGKRRSKCKNRASKENQPPQVSFSPTKPGTSQGPSMVEPEIISECDRASSDNETDMPADHVTSIPVQVHQAESEESTRGIETTDDPCLQAEINASSPVARELEK